MALSRLRTFGRKLRGAGSGPGLLVYVSGCVCVRARWWCVVIIGHTIYWSAALTFIVDTQRGLLLVTMMCVARVILQKLVGWILRVHYTDMILRAGCREHGVGILAHSVLGKGLQGTILSRSK